MAHSITIKNSNQTRYVNEGDIHKTSVLAATVLQLLTKEQSCQLISAAAAITENLEERLLKVRNKYQKAETSGRGRD